MSIKIGNKTYNTKGTIWKPEVKTTTSGKTMIKASLSTGKKVGETFRNSNWFVTFVGDAAKKFETLAIVERDVIEITSGEVENVYSKEKGQSYLSVTIYDFEKVVVGSTDSSTPASSTASNGDGFMNIPDGIDEELPFN